MRIMGVDEAGRGSVLGPLVLGGFAIEDGDLEALVRTGVTDSKRLTPRRRERLVPELERLGQGRVQVLEATVVDRTNINLLEMETMALLLRELRPDRAYIDAPTHPAAIPRFVRELRALLDHQPELVVEPKADLNYPVVGAASVLAKVRRDREVAALGPVGSGYPSDPVTRDWIRGFLERGEPLPACVRTRWGTVADLCQQVLFGGHP